MVTWFFSCCFVFFFKLQPKRRSKLAILFQKNDKPKTVWIHPTVSGQSHSTVWMKVISVYEARQNSNEPEDVTHRAETAT